MNEQFQQAIATIMNLLGQSKIELSNEGGALEMFLDRALEYLAASDRIRSVAEQKAYILSRLVPAERASKGKFSFVLEHNIDPQKGSTIPTIQISGTDGNYHALIIKRQDLPLRGHAEQNTLQIAGSIYQIGVATDRIRANVDLAKEFPSLDSLKKGCQLEGRPIIYFLGAARRFPDGGEQASLIEGQIQAVNDIFETLDSAFGDNVIIGTGGWAGTNEGSLGIPRIGYLHAVSTNQLILTTMPRVGAYDRHENPTLEVFCGQEWGDDSSVLAATCDAAFVFRPHGTWTQIEVENLLAQNKPFVVIDDPKNSQLRPDENKKRVKTQRGNFHVYRHPRAAANDLLRKLGEAGFIYSRRPSRRPAALFAGSAPE